MPPLGTLGPRREAKLFLEDAWLVLDVVGLAEAVFLAPLAVLATLEDDAPLLWADEPFCPPDPAEEHAASMSPHANAASNNSTNRR